MASTHTAPEDPENRDSKNFLITRLQVLFAGLKIEPSVGAIASFVETLEDLRPEQIDHGVHQALRRCKRSNALTPAELREICLEKSVTPTHPADCKRCAGSGWFYHPEEKRAVRCRDYPL